ncbi:MAG TPA: hypothetical protein VG099_27040, partial [Gemmataceae bacterium]|nr:hypothetical protein [Gemmataceae bacterium]
MTLIIGIKCSNGVVLGADGAATLGSMGQPTVRQPVKKLTVLEDKVIVGVSGWVGLGQRIQSEIEGLWKAGELLPQQEQPAGQFTAIFTTQAQPTQRAPRTPEEAMVVIRHRIGEHCVSELRYAGDVMKATGQAFPLESALAATLVAFPFGNIPCLVQFDQQGAPELATVDLPFITIGSGRGNADSFLAFLRRIFWGNAPPALADGLFA